MSCARRHDAYTGMPAHPAGDDRLLRGKLRHVGELASGYPAYPAGSLRLPDDTFHLQQETPRPSPARVKNGQMSGRDCQEAQETCRVLQDTGNPCGRPDRLCRRHGPFPAGKRSSPYSLQQSPMVDHCPYPLVCRAIPPRPLIVARCRRDVPEAKAKAL